MKSTQLLTGLFSIRFVSFRAALCCLIVAGLGGFAGSVNPVFSADAESATADVTSEFSAVNQRLFFDNHLANTNTPHTLRYTFNKKSNFENDPPFDDVVVVNLTASTEGRKTATVEYFTGDRKRSAPEFTNVIGNPILTLALQRDIYQMERMLNNELSWRHFQKRLKVAFEETARMDPTELTVSGSSVMGEKITVQPYVDDPLAKRFPVFREKTYIFTLSDKVPGTIYQITTVVNDPETGSAMEESFTYSGG